MSPNDTDRAPLPRSTCVLWLFLCLAGTASAQFSDLSTTNNGSILYFDSALPQRNTDQNSSPKIFMIDNSGLHLEVQTGTPISQLSPTFSSPQVSGNGAVLIYANTRGCIGGSSCFLSQLVFTNVSTPGRPLQTFPGKASLSPNGRYLASYGITQIGWPWQFQLTDLTTGTAIYQSLQGGYLAAVADNGTTLLANYPSLTLIKNGKATSLSNAPTITGVAIDAQATEAIWVTGSPSSPPRTVFGLDIPSGRQWQISPANTDSYDASLSANGKWVLYISQIGGTPQLFFGPTIAPSSAIQLTNTPAGVVEATLSGDGQYAFATLGDGSLLRIHTHSHTSETWIGPTPSIPDQFCTAPGSLYILTGAGLGTASVTIAGLTPLILSRSNTSIVFQVPWEAPISAATLLFPEGGAPYFTDSQSVAIVPFCPAVLPLGPEDPATFYTPVAIHSDGSLITPASPASAGEVISFFMTGGGTVVGPMIDGVPAPLSPLEWTTTGAFVTVDDINGLYCPFFGLAPTLLGVYQLQVQLPAPPPNATYLDLEVGYIEAFPPSTTPVANSLLLGTIPMK